MNTGENWLARWERGRIGWHQPDGNAMLRKYWPAAADGGRVLAPLCGKTPDLKWLAERGSEVTGIELSSLAAEAFFTEHALPFTRGEQGGLPCCRGVDLPVTICVGDYFEFSGERFDALYDRGALVAMPARHRPAYVAHTDSLLAPGAARLLVTLEYDQRVADGPPFAVHADEVLSYWPALARVDEHEDIDNCPPKFREAGLTSVIEAAWLG